MMNDLKLNDFISLSIILMISLLVSCFDQIEQEPLCFDKTIDLNNIKQKIVSLDDPSEAVLEQDDIQYTELLIDRDLTCVSPQETSLCNELYIFSLKGSGSLMYEALRAPWRFAINSIPLTMNTNLCDLPENSNDCYSDDDCPDHQRCIGLLKAAGQTLNEEDRKLQISAKSLCGPRESCSRCLTQCQASGDVCEAHETCKEVPRDALCFPK